MQSNEINTDSKKHIDDLKLHGGILSGGEL